jgi:hypothetical protein
MDGVPPRTREYGLDWLRVAAFAVLIFYHSGMIFVPWSFHIKDTGQSELLAWVMVFFNRWRLPLLFFISGCGVAFSLRRRTMTEFARERVRRLAIPLLFGIFFVVPPQIYVERLQKGAGFSFAEFYPTVFGFVPYPQGSTSWHHLWFVAYLLVYSLVGIPLFKALQNAHVARWLVRAVNAHPAVVYFINIPSLAAALTLGPRWPTTHNLIADWANLIGSFLTFLWGFAIAASPGFLDAIERRRNEFIAGAVTLTVMFYVLRFNGQSSTFVNGYMGMLWILAFVALARSRIRSGGAWLAYCNEAVYPFYILHQTVIVVTGFYIVQLPWGIPAKLALTMGVGFLGSWVGFELVRRWNVTRLLFGLKPIAVTSVRNFS